MHACVGWLRRRRADHYTHIHQHHTHGQSRHSSHDACSHDANDDDDNADDNDNDNTHRQHDRGCYPPHGGYHHSSSHYSIADNITSPEH